VLANELDAHVTAIDAAPAFVDRLAERASQAGLGDRIDARVGAMEDPPFEPESLDLIWSEAAIYNVGFEAGVQAWHRFLRPGGMLAVSELVWTTGSRPGEIDAHWKREYPGISTVSANLAALDRAGYRPEAFFILPDQAWDENYYAPLRDAIPGFLDRHAHGAGAQSIADAERAEMSLRGRFGAWYGYAFCIARVRE
jgi:SAM-dependent methyltransferase